MEGVIADLRIALGETSDRQIFLDSQEAGALILQAELLVVLGLITAEAVTNAIKYGAGHIRVQLAQNDAGLEIAVEDGGKGFPEGFDPVRDGTGLGLCMIASLVQARGGKITIGADPQTLRASPSRIAASIPI